MSRQDEKKIDKFLEDLSNRFLVKACVNCVHYRHKIGLLPDEKLCVRPIRKVRNYITGEPITIKLRIDCEIERKNGECGVNGKFHEERPEGKPSLFVQFMRHILHERW